MKAYVLTSGATFGLLTIAHVLRVLMERHLVTDPVFILFSLSQQRYPSGRGACYGK